MYMPSIFGRNMFDDFFDFSFDNRETNKLGEMMKSDVKETDQGYEVTMNLPGVKKEDVKADLKDGYLTIEATTGSGSDEKEENGRYIRRERYYGACSRKFYVGEDITEEDIKARFENGTLKLSIPKKEVKPAVEQKKYIAIEG